MQDTAALPLGLDGSQAVHVAHPDAATRPRSAFLMRAGLTLAVVAVIALAAWLRLSDLGYSSLSHAEAWRANWSDHGDWSQARRLPPLQYAMLWAVQQGAGRTEFLLRLPSAIAGILCVGILCAFVRRHVDVWSALLAASVAACHPVLVSQSRVLKVFSIEALMTIVVVWAGLAAYRRRSRRSLTAFLAVGLIAMGFTFTSILVVWAWVPLLAWAYTRPGEPGRASPRSFLVVAFLLAAAGTGCYAWLDGSINRQQVVGYFGTIEQAWPTAYHLPVLFEWLTAKSYGALRYVLGVSAVWPPLNWVIATMQLVAVAAGIGVLWQRSRPLCIVAAIVAVEVVAAGALRRWPFGECRTMTFLVPLAAIGIGCGLCQIARRLGRSPATILLMVVCLLIPAARASKAAYGLPQTIEHTRPVLAHIATHLQPGDSIFVYYAADDAFEFYWQDAGVPVLVQPRTDRGDFAAFAHRFEEWIGKHPRVWFVFTHNWGTERVDWIAHLEKEYRLVDKVETADASAHLFAAPPIQ